MNENYNFFVRSLVMQNKGRGKRKKICIMSMQRNLKRDVPKFFFYKLLYFENKIDKKIKRHTSWARLFLSLNKS